MCINSFSNNNKNLNVLTCLPKQQFFKRKNYIFQKYKKVGEKNDIILHFYKSLA